MVGSSDELIDALLGGNSRKDLRKIIVLRRS